MKTIFVTILAGILGTAGMSFMMDLITHYRIANADMIRAIGSTFTRSYENAFTPGLIIHFTFGVIIAFFYMALIRILSPNSVASSIGAGAMIGVFHGVAFSFLLVIAVAEHHPLEQFRKVGSEVAIAHFAGHIIYGLIVGTVLGIFGVSFL